MSQTQFNLVGSGTRPTSNYKECTVLDLLFKWSKHRVTQPTPTSKMGVAWISPTSHFMWWNLEYSRRISSLPSWYHLVPRSFIPMSPSSSSGWFLDPATHLPSAETWRTTTTRSCWRSPWQRWSEWPRTSWRTSYLMTSEWSVCITCTLDIPMT